MNRRVFLKTIGITAGGLTINPSLAIKELTQPIIENPAPVLSTNSLLTPDMIAREALMILEKNLTIHAEIMALYHDQKEKS